MARAAFLLPGQTVVVVQRFLWWFCGFVPSYKFVSESLWVYYTHPIYLSPCSVRGLAIRPRYVMRMSVKVVGVRNHLLAMTGKSDFNDTVPFLLYPIPISLRIIWYLSYRHVGFYIKAKLLVLVTVRLVKSRVLWRLTPPLGDFNALWRINSNQAQLLTRIGIGIGQGMSLSIWMAAAVTGLEWHSRGWLKYARMATLYSKKAKSGISSI